MQKFRTEGSNITSSFFLKKGSNIADLVKVVIILRPSCLSVVYPTSPTNLKRVT